MFAATLHGLIFGFILAGLIGYLACRAGSLSPSGAWAAVMTGGLIFGLGGLAWAVLLLVFFISSSILSRSFSRQKADLSEKFSKGHKRDWGQVLANGGLGAGLAILYAFTSEQVWLWIAFAGAMAAVNADTWATELGVLNSSPPRLITTFKPVERGSSGGISLLGSLAALAGGALIALFALLFHDPSIHLLDSAGLIFISVTVGGLLGSFFDSFLGATAQAIYYCPTCCKETERYPVHICGTSTSLIRGLSWLNNDLVNFAASLFGAVTAAGLWWLFQGS